MSFLGRIWSRMRGKEGDPTFGTQIAVVGAGAAVVDSQTDDKGTDATPDYGWSGDHLSGGSGYGGGGGFDGDGGGGDGGGDS